MRELVLIACIAIGSLPAADQSTDLRSALTGGTVGMSVRYRLEYVDRDGVGRDATASNLDTELSYRTLPWHGLSAFLAFEDVRPIGDDRFNSTRNGRVDFPVVSDPRSTDVDEAYLRYAGDQVRVDLGRQAIALDDQRWVGTVGWRLNDQSFDALSTHWQPHPDVVVFAAGVRTVQTVTDLARDLDHGALLNGAWTISNVGTLTAFTYLLDYEDGNGTDSATYGVRIAGAPALADGWTLPYEVSCAQQTDYGDRAAFSAIYLKAVVGAGWRGATVRGGVEYLGSDDGVAAVQTPLGTNHAFNGWADQFLVTPAGGLIDVFASAATAIPTVKGLEVGLSAHRFRGDEDHVDLGHEIDAQATWAWRHGLSFGLKGALYRAGDSGSDTTKTWAWSRLAF